MFVLFDPRFKTIHLNNALAITSKANLNDKTEILDLRILVIRTTALVMMNVMVLIVCGFFSQ